MNLVYKRIFFVSVMIVVMSMFASTPPRAENGKRYWLPILHHDLEVRLWPETSELQGYDQITFETGPRASFVFSLGKALSVIKVEVDGKTVTVTKVERVSEVSGAAEEKESAENNQNDSSKNLDVYELPMVKGGRHVLAVTYGGTVYDTLKVSGESRSGIPEETTGLIGPEGTYLCQETGWYPDTPDGYATFSMRLTTPAGVAAVTEGKRVSVIQTDKKTVTDWEAFYPTRDVVLVAGEYIVRDMEIEGVTLMAYFFPSEEDLIDSYLEASGRYIRLYNGLIGPYPFSKFAVVENFFPTGYGMPSYTLLGRRVIRLPFIIHTSLGHEVAHNWWGNSVYPDYDKGNWCEGLTAYYSDYRYKAEKSKTEAVNYRRDVNLDYTTFTAENNDMPLIDFRSKSDETTSAIGYGKCMMVFHMLRNQIGEDKFYRAMRNFYQRYKFRDADWKDIEMVFEEVTGRPLDDYFDRWVRRPGAPRLTLENVDLSESGDGEYYLGVTIGNEGGYELDAVPVVITGPSKTIQLSVSVAGSLRTFDWRLDERPRRIELDPDHEIFRRLDPAEVPAAIRNVLADTAVIALPSLVSPEKKEAYKELAGRLSASGKARVKQDSAFGESDFKARPVIVFGGINENTVYRFVKPPESVTLEAGGFMINGVEYADSGNAAFAAYENAVDPGQTVCAVIGNSADAIQKAGYKIIYYGKYGYVTFLNGDRIKTGEFPPARNPLVYYFPE